MASAAPKDQFLKWSLVWFLGQIFTAASGTIIYIKEVKPWQDKYNPNGFKNTWSPLTNAPFKWWAYEVIWAIGWSGLAVINLIFGLAGL
jgi:hypothetical protein